MPNYLNFPILPTPSMPINKLDNKKINHKIYKFYINKRRIGIKEKDILFVTGNTISKHH